MIKKCSRVILIGSNEMMDSLLRFQGDMVMMQKLVIQNTIIIIIISNLKRMI